MPAGTVGLSDTSIINSSNFCDFVGKHCEIGIDEAGRGPVLGPMVYGIAAILSDTVTKELLTKYGVTDSKAITEEAREDIFTKFNSEAMNCVAYRLEVISAHVISTSMLGRYKTSLNEISHNSAMSLIRACIEAGIIVDHVYVDTVGPPESYQRKLETRFPALNITVSKKADSLFASVSAASICAKVTRDRWLRDFDLPSYVSVAEEGFGSGYPGDPKTKQFLKDCCDDIYGFPNNLVRFSWQTAQDVMDKKCVAVKWEDDEDNSIPPPNTKSLFSYFGSKENGAGAKKLEKHKFFRERQLVHFDGF